MWVSGAEGVEKNGDLKLTRLNCSMGAGGDRGATLEAIFVGYTSASICWH
jgi:hypothetical protein